MPAWEPLGYSSSITRVSSTYHLKSSCCVATSVDCSQGMQYPKKPSLYSNPVVSTSGVHLIVWYLQIAWMVGDWVSVLCTVCIPGGWSLRACFDLNNTHHHSHSTHKPQRPHIHPHFWYHQPATSWRDSTSFENASKYGMIPEEVVFITPQVDFWHLNL